MKDRGSISNPGVALRDLIRGEARRENAEVDQTALAEVTDPGDGVTVEIQLDGFAAGPINATWASSLPASAGQRVVVLVLRGGQQFFVTGVVGELAAGGDFLPLSGGTVTGDILASATDTHDLGSAALSWLGLYANDIYDEAGVKRLDLSADWTPAGNVNPDVDNGGNLGTSLLSWSNVFAYNIVDEAGTTRLDLSGDWTPAGDVKPDVDNGGNLGTAALSWTNLYAYNLRDNAGTMRWDLSADMTPAGVILMPDGVIGAPAYSFANDTDTGIWLSAVGTLTLTAGGVNGLNITANYIIAKNVVTGTFAMKQNAKGVAATPTYSFQGDIDTGMYWSAADIIGFSAGAADGLFISSTLTYAGAATGHAALKNNGVGDVSTPAYTFVGDLDTGMYRPDADAIEFATGGVERLRIGTANITAAASVAGAAQLKADGAGTVGDPAFQFATDPNTGMYRDAADVIGFSAGGQAYLKVTTTGSGIEIGEDLNAIGDVTVLRAVRTGGGTGTTEVGYHSSWRKHKKKIRPLVGDHWRREWFMDLEPVTFIRKSSKAREFGFTIENLSENTIQLTVDGDKRVGDSPSEWGLLAVTIDYVQDLERRVAELEKAA